MKNRRDFLKQSVLLAAGAIVAPKIAASESFFPAKSKNIGLQLYSLRQMVGKDGIQAVLDTVAAIGYKNLETAGYSDGKIYNLDPADFKKRVENLDMKFTSAHIGQNYSKEKESQVMDWWKKAIQAHHDGGASYMVMPSLPVNRNSKLDDLKLYCEYFSKVGALTADAGITFGFHNHTEEFQKIGDHVIFDYMLANVDKAKVIFELDVYWCQVGGSDPVEYLKKYPDQIRLTHIKDAKEIGASGTMDFKAIFKEMKANGVRDWYVEIEEYTHGDPVRSTRESFEYLDAAKYVK